MPDAGSLPSYALGIINQDQAIKLWPQIEHLIGPLLAQEGLYHPVDILAFHIRGEMLIWVAWDMVSPQIDAVMVTQIVRFPRKTICAVPYIAGRNMRRWARKLQEETEKYARAQGCAQMGGGYRKGWARVAGYEVTGVTLRKNL